SPHPVTRSPARSAVTTGPRAAFRLDIWSTPKKPALGFDPGPGMVSGLQGDLRTVRTRPSPAEKESKSVQVDAGLAADLRAVSLPHREVDRIADEPDRAVRRADVHAARVVARRGDVRPTEGRIAAVVLLGRRVAGLLVPVDRQRVRVERVAVDPTPVV